MLKLPSVITYSNENWGRGREGKRTINNYTHCRRRDKIEGTTHEQAQYA